MIYLFVFIFKWYPIILCINAITVVTITRGKQAFTFTVVNLHHWMKIKRFKSWMHILSLIYQDKIRDVWSSSNSSVRIHWPLECLKSFFFFCELRVSPSWEPKTNFSRHWDPFKSWPLPTYVFSICRNLWMKLLTTSLREKIVCQIYHYVLNALNHN